jgi:hypothetical protein
MTIHQHNLLHSGTTYVQVGHAYRIPLLIASQIQGLILSTLPFSSRSYRVL